jgi:GTP-binding protein HflX
MAETFEIKEIEEKVILVGISEQDGDDANDSLLELAELVKTAGATVVGTLIQKREKIHPGTYVGTGKVLEIARLAEETGATGIVCDDELSPAQIKNLEELLQIKIMDRTLIILDISVCKHDVFFRQDVVHQVFKNLSILASCIQIIKNRLQVVIFRMP